MCEYLAEVGTARGRFMLKIFNLDIAKTKKSGTLTVGPGFYLSLVTASRVDIFTQMRVVCSIDRFSFGRLNSLAICIYVEGFYEINLITELI